MLELEIFCFVEMAQHCLVVRFVEMAQHCLVVRFVGTAQRYLVALRNQTARQI
jgi:hypothetical protein